jgi:hypothetical protein
MVTVTVGRDNKNKYTVRVAVYSNKKHGLKASTDIDPGQCQGAAQLNQLIAIAGAACAEYLCQKHGEEHDPSACGRSAVDDFARECRLMEELKEGFPEKVARLMASPLLPPERQRLDQLSFFIKRGSAPTSEDSAWVNGLLARHSRRKR